MKKNLASFAIIIMILLGGIFLLKKEKLINQNTITTNNNLAFLVCDGLGANCEDSLRVPTGDYILDEERTYCEAGGKISNYDSTLGTIKYTIKGNDECKVYFNLLMKLEPTTLQGIWQDGSAEMNTYTTIDTGVPTPTDFDEIEYIDIQQLAKSGIYNNEAGMFDVDRFAEEITGDFCSEYQSYCYTVTKISGVKISLFLNDITWDVPTTTFDEASSLKFSYNYPNGGYNWFFAAFRLKKSGYVPSAWYYVQFGVTS